VRFKLVAMSVQKTQQVQLRVSPQQKAALKRAAGRAGMDMSEWILARTLPSGPRQFAEVVESLAAAGASRTLRRLALAAVHDFLAQCSQMDLAFCVAEIPLLPRDELAANYLAAMVEKTCYCNAVCPPTWCQRIEPLKHPYFASDLLSLRLYLLRVSPPPFKRRNLFVDATIGGRV
jgi:hypothetical protein